MTTAERAPTDAVVAPVSALVERVFGAVLRLRDLVVEGQPDGASPARPTPDVAAVRASAQALLAAHRDIAIGMGLIVAPGMSGQAARRVLWWQSASSGAEPVALRVDLNPRSIGYYDYGSADWFSVPAASGGRHVDGPYVDVHGTDRYLLTFTMPVLTGSGFVGVVGADVPVSRFETLVLRAWGRLDADVVIVNGEDRVVVSNSSRALAGDLVRGSGGPRAQRRDVPGMPWHLLVAPRG